MPVGQPGGLWGNLVVPASMNDCRQCLERSSMGGLLELRLLPGHSSSALAGQLVCASGCLFPESLILQKWT